VARIIDYQQIIETVGSLCKQACYELPAETIDALAEAAKRETNPRAAKILNQLVENARIAADDEIPLCQDTGLAVVFVELGCDCLIKSPKGRQLYDAINEGVAAGYKDSFLRSSVVAEPLQKRKNTGTNTPAVIHCSITAGDKLKITVMAKGGGCENKSRFSMFKPTAEKQQVINWIVDVVKNAGADACPPFIVGIGIGGNFETSCLLAKKALVRNLNEKNKEPFYARMEAELLSAINSLGIGPQGLGGDTTALACLIETAPCHIASLPVAVNIECHSHRHKSAII
jgi:fumarate hydratase subunit alpha